MTVFDLVTQPQGRWFRPYQGTTKSMYFELRVGENIDLANYFQSFFFRFTKKAWKKIK